MEAYQYTPAEEALMAVKNRADVAACPPPFYVVRLRNQMLSLARQFFSTQHQFPSAENTEDIPVIPDCLRWSKDDDQRTLEVLPLFYAQPPETEKATVFVSLGDVKFSAVSLDNSVTGVSATQHVVTGVKRAEGTVTFTMQHREPDIALYMLELLQTALEGSRMEIMRNLNLLTFNSTLLTSPAATSNGPQRTMRSSLSFAFLANIEITTTEQSIPTRQVATTTQATQ